VILYQHHTLQQLPRSVLQSAIASCGSKQAPAQCHVPLMLLLLLLLILLAAGAGAGAAAAAASCFCFVCRWVLKWHRHYNVELDRAHSFIQRKASNRWMARHIDGDWVDAADSQLLLPEQAALQVKALEVELAESVAAAAANQRQ
jgi:hypothetical protein